MIKSTESRRPDKGYQGLQKLYPNSQIPVKKPRGGELSVEDKVFNCSFGQQRIVIEHINRQTKIFKIISERYRNRRLGLCCNLMQSTQLRDASGSDKRVT